MTLARKVSLTDPAAIYIAASGIPAFYANSTTYLIDTDHGIIVDVEPTTANRAREGEATKTMLDRVEARFAIKAQRLIGDAAYETSAMLGWLLEEKAIAPHAQVWDKSERKDDTFSRSGFWCDEQVDEYHCPMCKAPRSGRRSFKELRALVTKFDRIGPIQLLGTSIH